MLSPDPRERYAVAGKVIQSLKKLTVPQTSDWTMRSLESKNPQDTHPTAAESPVWQDLSFVILVSVFFGLTGIAGWRLLSGLKPAPSATTAAQNFSPALNNEQKTQEALRDDRERLGISFDWFS